MINKSIQGELSSHQFQVQPSTNADDSLGGLSVVACILSARALNEYDEPYQNCHRDRHPRNQIDRLHITYGLSSLGAVSRAMGWVPSALGRPSSWHPPTPALAHPQPTSISLLVLNPSELFSIRTMHARDRFLFIYLIRIDGGTFTSTCQRKMQPSWMNSSISKQTRKRAQELLKQPPR